MSSDFRSGPVEALRHELEALRAGWWWFLLLGILLIVVGTTAITYSVLATVMAVAFIGVLLVMAGGAQLVAAFWAGNWSGFLLSVLAAILHLVVGAMLIARPVAAGEALALLIGAFFLVGGLFRIIAAMALRVHHWGWLLLNGAVTALLGLLVLGDWPGSSLWVIGTLIGVDLLFHGWVWVMLAFGLRNVPERAQ
ncbi:MAG: HdeD family acid-resistance protein [Pirellulales bacterium]